MKTLFLGAYGFGNLGDELCLMQAISAFPSQEVWVRTVDKEFTSRFIKCSGFIEWEPANPKSDFKVNFDRVVLGGGGILGNEGGDHYMNWIVAAQNSGAKTYVHNVGITKNNADWITSEIRNAFKKLDGLSVRDKESVELLRGWGIEGYIGLTNFPERSIPKVMSLADSLSSQDKILGVAISNTNRFMNSLHVGKLQVEELILQYKGMKVLPIISTVHKFSNEENDIEGFKRFYDMFLKDFEIILPETLGSIWWHENMTPQRLKGLISKCDVFISRRKHNCVHSISCGVKTIGLSSEGDGGLPSVFNSLENQLSYGSRYILLPNS